jgi:hypothetical protein
MKQGGFWGTCIRGHYLSVVTETHMGEHHDMALGQAIHVNISELSILSTLSKFGIRFHVNLSGHMKSTYSNKFLIISTTESYTVCKLTQLIIVEPIRRWIPFRYLHLWYGPKGCRKLQPRLPSVPLSFLNWTDYHNHLIYPTHMSNGHLKDIGHPI